MLTIEGGKILTNCFSKGMEDIFSNHLHMKRFSSLEIKVFTFADAIVRSLFHFTLESLEAILSLHSHMAYQVYDIKYIIYDNFKL